MTTKSIYFLFLSLFFTPFFISAEEPSKTEEIRIHLSSDASLSMLYLGKIAIEEAPLFDNGYVSQLEKILQFDFNHSGLTKVLPQTDQKEDILSKKDLSLQFNRQTWENFGIPYVIKPTLSGKMISIDVFSTHLGSLKHFKNIPLTGQLQQDRHEIHKLADSIHKALFEKNGIANSRILYSVQMKTPRTDGSQWISEIWECDWDGGNARQITKENSYCITPLFVPSNPRFASNRFIYVSYKLGQPKIYISSLKGSPGKRLVDLKGNQLLPAISSKRDKLAFICDASGRTDLFIQHFDPDRGEIGKPVQLFSYPKSTQASPTFSPDGEKIAFVSDKDGSPRIYLISSKPGNKRSNPILITKQNVESSCPSWSPDGTKLAYSAKTNGIRQIWIYDFTAKEEKQLTYGPGNKENPCWAPNSLHLVFNSTDTSSSELYLVNLNEPEAIKITHGSGKKHYPSWTIR